MNGHRRIDRVLDEAFLADLHDVPLAELRRRRDEALQEESDQSYLRRLLQGRIDIVAAELSRRSGGGGGSIVDALPRILGEGRRGDPQGSGRHLRVEPSRVDQHRRRVEALVADVDLSNVTARSDDELTSALETLRGEEHAVSEQRRAVQAAADACATELARRYRDGEARVAELLPPEVGEP